MVTYCTVINMHFTIESTPGSVPRYFKISEHPIEAAKWTGCHPC